MLALASCCSGCDNGCNGSPTAYDIPFNWVVYGKFTNETIIGRCLSCSYSHIAAVLVDQNGDTIRTNGTINAGGGMSLRLIKRGVDSTDYPIHREYFLHLVDFNDIERDIDTIRFDFTLINSGLIVCAMEE